MITNSQAFTYLQDHSNFTSINEMDQHVKSHVEERYNDLKQSTREVLFNIAKHALKYIGAAHLKAETIANEIEMSTKSVYRAVKELVEFGIIAKENKPKRNGIKGANVYSILPYVSSNVPSEMSEREKPEKPCETKVETAKKNPEALNLLSTNKSLKDTNITENHIHKNKVSKESILKEALMAKLPAALNGLQLFFDKSQDVYDMAGVIFNAKDKSVKIEEHENLFRKTIKSVYEYWQRQVRNGNPDYNVFGLMRKAIIELTDKIIAGTAYDKPVNNAPAVKLNNVPNWLPVNPTVFNSKEIVPEWMRNRNDTIDPAPVKNNEIDFEAERARILAKLSK